MSDTRLFKFDDFQKYNAEKRLAESLAQEELNENNLKTLAAAAAMAASSVANPAMADAPVDANHNTSITAATGGNGGGGTGTVTMATPATVDAALRKLEHRKQFKMKYTGDKSAIIGIGAYDYPVFKSNSPEQAEYLKALNGAKSSQEKLFWANGLVYANPFIHSSEGDALMADATTVAEEPVAPVVAPAPVAANNTAHGTGAAKLKMSDISSFIVKGQGLWDLHSRGGSLTVKVSGAPRTYRDKNDFVRDYVTVEYKMFAKNRFNQVVADSEIHNLINDAIDRVGE